MLHNTDLHFRTNLIRIILIPQKKPSMEILTKKLSQQTLTELFESHLSSKSAEQELQALFSVASRQVSGCIKKKTPG